MCVGSKVAIKGRNFHPRWGLYNGAIGTVKHIHFIEKDGQQPNPNENDLPDYIVVHFPQYKGPTWNPDEPKVSNNVFQFIFKTLLISVSFIYQDVPLPCVTEKCQKNFCCSKTFVPLVLSYATTIHRCQGLTIGPSNSDSKSQNIAKSMIVDIGSRKFELANPGLFYTAFSRVTTIGDGSKSQSSLFFTGDTVTDERLLKMTYKKDSNEKTIIAQRRDAWIQLLNNNTHRSRLTKTQRTKVFKWISNTNRTQQWLISHVNRLPRTSYIP